MARIGKDAAQGGRAGIRVDGGGVEIELAGYAVRRTVRQSELYLRVAAARGDEATRLLLAGELLDLRRGLVEIHIDRIELVDGGQQRRRALTDERALRHLLLAGDARDRRRHVGVAEIDARRLDVGLGLFDGG